MSQSSNKFEVKTSSGHRAGLHSGDTFGQIERTLKHQRDEELKQINSSSLGKHEETVYRDKKGKKLDMVNEFMKQQNIDSIEYKKKLIDEAQYEWGKGSVQKKNIEDARQDLKELASAPFARTIDDPKLERSRKELIRDGDPMAQYFIQKQSTSNSSNSTSQDNVNASYNTNKKRKYPIYKGPLPPPNRFQIQPGYRWDAIDRGNQFEKRIMTKMNSSLSLKEDEYKWSVSDL